MPKMNKHHSKKINEVAISGSLPPSFILEDYYEPWFE
jgi:hypothetical protein